MPDARKGHAVLPEVGEVGRQAYASLRSRPTPRAERYELGRQLRDKVSRESMGDWTPPADRYDPIRQIEFSHDGRIDWLIPVRAERMVESPYGFLRGTAIVMARDVALLPSTGINPVISGDSHLGNFGFYASPERDLVIDLNDFDEAHPGGWEWDLRRLVASIWVAGRQNGRTEAQCEEAVAACVRAYRVEVSRLADEPLMSRSFQRLTAEKLQADATEGSLRKEIKRATKKARRRTSDRVLPRFTEEHEGTRRLVEEPPITTRISARDEDLLAEGLDEYLTTLGADVFRSYLMFLGPWDQGGDWNDDGITGPTRFARRVWGLVEESGVRLDRPIGAFGDDAATRQLRQLTHRTIAGVTEDLERFRFNTTIAKLMTFSGELAEPRAVPAR